MSRIIIIILSAAAICLLMIMGMRVYKEGKIPKAPAENRAAGGSEAGNKGSGKGAADAGGMGGGTAAGSGVTGNGAAGSDFTGNGAAGSNVTGSGVNGNVAAGNINDQDTAFENIINSMNLEEKIAQMFIITPEALTGFEQVTDAGEATRNGLVHYPVGGLVYFKPNIQNPQQVKEMIASTKEFADSAVKLPILIAVDEEGGTVARLAGNPQFSVEKFPDMSVIGASGDLDKAYEVGQTIGGYLKEYGFNMNFAPDADVLTNPGNTVVAMRSFGSDPGLVSAMAGQVAEGLKDQGIIPVYKHFPGHGSTKGDTHEGFAYTDRTLDELRKSELVPFAQAVNDGRPCIMAAHIAAVAVDGNKPASLSKTLITDVLREEMGFTGVVITDALNMGAIQSLYSSGDAAILAVEAGADILLMPADFKEAYEALVNAVKEGRISEERIIISLKRIAAMKAGL
nr:glycoside hydrolase family 3 protein [Clostridium sp. MCC353]